LCISGFAQTNNHIAVNVDGIVRDQGNRVIPGLRLEFRNEISAVNTFTDINGHFDVKLAEGDYVLTIDSVSPSDFKAFIRISPKSLNPTGLDLRIDASTICTDWQSKYPAFQESIKPPFPPVAKAVRAYGEVSVKVVINRDGKVVSAEAVSGHPLLKAAARKAAETSSFVPSNQIENRLSILTYIFLIPEGEKPSVERLSIPCRVVISTEPVVIDTARVY
jgi:TonB family protein